MANEFNKEEVVLFEQVLEKFDSDNIVAKQASRFSQPGKEMQRRGDSVWRPQPMISTTVDGLDITSKIGSVTQLSVPATLSTIENVPFQLNAKELRDEMYREQKARSAAQALSAVVNRAMANNIKTWGSLTVDVAGALSGYDDISLCDALMIENDITNTDKTMVLNARDYNLMAGNLASRTLRQRSELALSNAELGDIAGFNTFKTSFGPTLTAAAGGGGITVDGEQKYVPTSTSTATSAVGEVENVDNRTMDLTVSSTTNVAAGDKFTIADVNAVSHVNKNDTGQLKTFTVVEVVDSTTLKIAPPIIVKGDSDAETDYANCSQAALDTKGITFLNTDTVQTNMFFVNDSIEIFGGRLAFDDEMAGVAVTRMTTDSGIEIIFAKQGDVKTGVSTYRFTVFFGVTNLNPEMNGVLLGGQTS